MEPMNAKTKQQLLESGLRERFILNHLRKKI
ncbi:hypothetical protein EZS27_002140 [termite gut metagenome]|uniref:Uncharacterized protein n=1 Tax=termite gut metagenome TaxID=433724 RepID=A0A5J4SYV1_9ZZZZ